MEGLRTLSTSRLEGLHVVGVRYRNSTYASGDERALDAYARSGVYEESRVPVTVVEPRLPDDERSGLEPRDVGALCGKIADEVATGRRRGSAVLMVGGNCVHAMGVIGGIQDVHGPGARIGLIWFDAHGDFNTPLTSESGSLGGMPVAVAAGLAHNEWRRLSHVRCPLPPHRIMLVGSRDLDDAESRLINASGVPVATVDPTVGMEREMAFMEERCDLLYLHIDCDILDERHVPNHRTRAAGGPDISTVAGAVERVMASGKVVAFAVVSASGEGPGHEISVGSCVELLRRGLGAWGRFGLPRMLPM